MALKAPCLGAAEHIETAPLRRGEGVEIARRKLSNGELLEISVRSKAAIAELTLATVTPSVKASCK